MHELDIFLRIVHIVAGVFWVGSIFLFVIAIFPIVRSLGPSGERSFWLKFLSSPLTVIYPIAAVSTIAAGVTLALRSRWGNLDSFFATGWGWAILLGFLGVFVSLVLVIVMEEPASKKVRTILVTLQGREPDSAQASQIRHLMDRVVRSNQYEAVALLVSVGAMAAARSV